MPTRTNRSARAAGTRHETSVATYLAQQLQDDRIERRARAGAKDRGDIAGIRYRGRRVVIEAKNTTRTNLAGWIKEAHREAGNDDAAVGIVVAKRHGNADPADQWVHMTLADLAWLLGADAPTYDE
ncbi:hypothetical protein M3G50_07445 [Brachybacterium muris]|uniref:hypothetical protein n=1 Tax=Brachybacterium muris TaxID=219301 RepID=UPI0021A3100D|nr:hypothetical protein [Brachybacterium muris]MCT1430587.1 hypothetical protein [Brachybacterium muris]